ncbi:response regulator transcription factor [Adlercreutzia sp. ZJ242]|uniref:response regulator transcription factor n=1 Tax=Adlercreutzia sp. ZJ242 TaxID=2709409 RepID=UPI001F14E056|nr:response regulator transcription factor [Adlercreutzia sp. ZJ242]
METQVDKDMPKGEDAASAGSARDAASAGSARGVAGSAGAVDAPRVLVCDDEAAIAELVASLLADAGMRVQACLGARRALELFEEQPFDLVILDVMMPGMDGFELCCRMRAASEVPIMFLTARDEEADQVVGFTLGADDYVTKPFKPRELVARVKARLRRARCDQAVLASPDVVVAGGIEVDLRAHKAALYGEALPLTPKEFAILALLARRAGAPVPTRDIFEEVWGERYDASAANTVMVHIRHLRKKLAAVDASTAFIETAWGVGYKLAAGAGGGA